MTTTVSNQPIKGDVYFGVRLYKKGKYIGSHNGVKKTKKIQWFTKDYVDMFIDELKEKAEILDLKVVIESKGF
jgi:hypothetical protein|tara:strand:+ start:111 stop:329 length:219 start_codon:yes stop_codon:yes gene_type:complete